MIGLFLLLALPFVYARGIKRPEVVLLSWLVLGPLSYKSLVVLGVDARVITIDRCFCVMSILTLAANGCLRDLLRPRFSRFEKAFLTFFLVFLLEAVLKFPPRAAFSVWTNSLDAYAIPFYLFLLTRYLLTRNGTYDSAFESKIVLMLVLVGLYCAPMSIFEGLTGIDLMPGPYRDMLRYKGGDIPRTNGPFWAPGVLGGYLSYTMLLVVYRMRLARLSGSQDGAAPRWITVPYSLLVLAGLYFVMFRNVWMGFISGWASRFFLTSRGLVMLAFIGLLAFVGWEILGDSITKSSIYEERVGNVNTLYDRLGAWLYAFKAFSEHPLTGIGTGNIRHYIEYQQEYGEDLRVMDWRATYHPHNSVIAALAELGLLGVVPFCLILVFFVGEVRGCVRLARNPEDVEFGIYAVSAAFAILLPGLTDRCFEWAKLNNLMYVIFGIISAHHIKVRDFVEMDHGTTPYGR